MKKNKVKEIDIVAKTPFVGLYKVKYENKLNMDREWMVASRKSKEDLEKIYLDNKEDEIDAVVVAALHKSTNKLVLIKQFRVPINDYIYELPAGLVDGDEDVKKTVERELKEETGLRILDINKTNSSDKLYLSPGMTDESVAFVYCVCDGELSKEFLEEDEDIEAILVSREEAKNILSSNSKIDIKCYLVLQIFINIGEKAFIDEI
ncbi:MAG: NUDIX hydrolase [Romboutsia sp.]